MALFDYSRRMTEPEKPSPDVTAEQQRQIVQPEPERQEPVVLRQVPVDEIRASLKPGLLRVDFPDVQSETGKGFMFVKPGDVRQSLSAEGSPVSGKADVVISADGQTTSPYFVVQNGKPVRMERDVSYFVEEQERACREAAEQARQSVQNQCESAEHPLERSADYE